MFGATDLWVFPSRVFDIHSLPFQGAVCVVWLAGAIGCLRLGRGDDHHPGSARGGWRAAAVVLVLFAVELPLRLRWALSEFFRARLGSLKLAQATLNNRSLQAGLIVVGALVLVPTVLVALVRTRRLSAAAKVVWAGAGVSFSGFALEAISLHQVDRYGFVYALLVATGALMTTAGWVAATVGTGRRAARPGPAAGVAPRPGAVETLPAVVSLACLLYVFGHGPVADHALVKLVGGLGAALLFAAAGAVGAWATAVVSLPRLAVFAGLFAMLGVSFNVALHPASRPVATADILQGLSLCGLAVAAWRRFCGASAWGDATLAALPLLVHFLVGPAIPDVPGVQYLFANAASTRSLFPLFPWLTMAALGARAASSGIAACAATAGLFAAATALAWRAQPAGYLPVKFPMDLTYALLSCAAIEAAFVVAVGLRRLGAVMRASQWLGRNWLIYFYLHFAVAAVLARLGQGSPALVWTELAAGALAATWLLAAAAAPCTGLFRRPAAWAVPLALVALAGSWPGLRPPAVLALSAGAGLIFAAYHGTLAYVVVNLPAVDVWSAGRGLIRVAAVLALLAVPELVGLVEGRWISRPGIDPARDPRRTPAPERSEEPKHSLTIPLGGDLGKVHVPAVFEEDQAGVRPDPLVERPCLCQAGAAIFTAGQDQHRHVPGNAADRRKWGNLLPVGQYERRGSQQAPERDPVEEGRQGILGAVPDGRFEVLVGTLQDVSRNAMAERRRGEQCRGRSQRGAMDQDRLSRPAPFEELDRGDDVVAGAEPDIVDLARRVAMGPERDQEQRAALGRQHLRAAQAMDSTAAVAVQQHDRRSLFSALDEPGPELLPIAGPEPVGLDFGPRNGRDRLAEGRAMTAGQPVRDGE